MWYRHPYLLHDSWSSASHPLLHFLGYPKIYSSTDHSCDHHWSSSTLQSGTRQSSYDRSEPLQIRYRDSSGRSRYHSSRLRHWSCFRRKTLIVMDNLKLINSIIPKHQFPLPRIPLDQHTQCKTTLSFHMANISYANRQICKRCKYSWPQRIRSNPSIAHSMARSLHLCRSLQLEASLLFRFSLSLC